MTRLLWMFFIVAAGAAQAGDLTLGCFHRDYSDAHLRNHPSQVVDWITLIVEKDTENYTVARMAVGTANQGHVRRAGLGNQVFRQWLFCYDDGGRAACGVDCDGGRFHVTRDTGDVLTFETRYLLVGETEECGGAIDLAETPGKPVKYRLDRVPVGACDGM